MVYFHFNPPTEGIEIDEFFKSIAVPRSAIWADFPHFAPPSIVPLGSGEIWTFTPLDFSELTVFATLAYICPLVWILSLNCPRIAVFIRYLVVSNLVHAHAGIIAIVVRHIPNCGDLNSLLLNVDSGMVTSNHAVENTLSSQLLPIGIYERTLRS